MRKPKSFKIKPFEVKRGLWKYRAEELTEIEIEKGSKVFNGTQEVYEELESVKIGKNIYDIEKVEDGKVYLTEEVAEDFKGVAIYEWTLPVIIRSSSETYFLSIDAEGDFPKANRKVTPLSRCDKQTRTLYLNTVTEDKGDVSIDASNIMLITVDEFVEKQTIAKNNYIRSLLELVLNIDMDYEDESGKDLWTVLGVKKGNFVALTQLLISPKIGILANDEQVLKLKLTIEAISKAEKDVDAYVETKTIETNMFKSLEEIRKMYGDDEEGYKAFIENMIEGLKTNEGNQLQHTDN
jgi:hypothetical protein